MGPWMYLYSSLELGRPREELERDIREALSDRVTVISGGTGGDGWFIDLAVARDADLDETFAVVAAFLRLWGVPPDTHLHGFPFYFSTSADKRDVRLFQDCPETGSWMCLAVGQAPPLKRQDLPSQTPTSGHATSNPALARSNQEL
jgi:hypothetical protein